MKVLEVIPVAKGLVNETLSYFTGSDVPVGSLIKIPLRKRIVPAIVIDSRDAHESKSEIKNSTFALKKIDKIKSNDFFRSEFIETAKEMSDFYIGQTGAVLSSIVPKILFEIADKFKIDKIENKNNISAEKFVIQSNDEDRYAHYKSIIREEFAKNSSVFFCLPTIQDIKKASESLQKGIENYTYILHSAIGKKEITETIKKILEETHPILIIGTGPFLSIPKGNVGTIIIEKENSRSYKLQSRPYIDIRTFAEKFAGKIKAKIIFGDLLLRAESIYRFRKNELVEIAPLKFRSLTTSSQEIIDMKVKRESGEKAEFKIFSDSLLSKIKESIENSEHIFLFTSRRGLSPSTVCADCENIVKCNNCGSHIVLHKSSTENFFLCHRCGERRNAKELCTNCGSWRLTTLGIGSELVEEKLKELFPEAKLFRIDADTSPTHNKAERVAQNFYNSTGSILIGTEMSLLYLTDKIENSAVVSMDSFFSIPDYRINERVLNIILKMRAITDRNLILQTRDIEQKVFDYAARGNLIDFYKEEIDDRKRFNYPPFSTLIKISVTGTKSELADLVENFQKIIEPNEIDIFPAFVPQTKGKFGVNGLIKVSEGEWPNKDLSEKLKSLPMNFSVNVDPESLI